jgi:hypothetical protein
MTKIVLENTRTHDLTICVPTENKGILHARVPGARPHGDDQKLVNGRAEVDAEIVELGRANSKIVEHYFAEGWLKEVGSVGRKSKAA